MKRSSKKKEIVFGTTVEKTFMELFEEHQNYCKMVNLSPATIATYKHSTKYFLEFTGEDILCSQINQTLIDDYKLHLIDEGEIKPITINTYIRNISPIIKYGFKKGYIKTNIEFNSLKVQEEIKELYTNEELKVLLKKPNPKNRGFAEFRNWVIINFLLSTGVRARELRNIKISDLDLENCILRLQVTKNKKARIIPVSSALKYVLIEYLTFRHNQKDDEYLFPNIYGEPMPRSTLQMTITKYCKKRGIEKYSLHLFRHKFATEYLRNGGNPLTLQRILGHSSLKMVNRYIQMNSDDLQQDIDKFNPLDNIVKTRITKNKT